MGCDIHPVIVVRDRSHFEGYWRAAAFPDDSRCYALFEAVGGVRCGYGDNPVPRVVERDGLEGLPEDLIRWAKPEKYLSNEHSPRWITLREAKAYDDSALATAYNNTDGPQRQWRSWIRLMEFVMKEHEGATEDEVIVVFDFDS